MPDGFAPEHCRSGRDRLALAFPWLQTFFSSKPPAATTMVRNRIRQASTWLTLATLVGAAPDSTSGGGFSSLFNGRDLS